jgi:capsular polysaccharide biosynthesis protein
MAIVSKANAHQFKIRDRDANRLLRARFADEWGEVVQRRPAACGRRDVRLFTHGEGPTLGDKSVMEVPDRFLRRYRTALAWPQQRLRHADYWLPDTFRHALDTRLGHRWLINTTAAMARIGNGAPGPTRRVDGPLFYFDTEFPAQFGHVMSEVVSRYWGWQTAREIEPGIRPLLSLHPSAREVPSFQRTVFAALGIDVEGAVLIGPGECLEVSGLYAATPDFVMPQYAAPELADVWDAIRRECAPSDSSHGPQRLFVSRRSKGIRTCLNAAEVEETFERLGYEVMYPEDHDFRTQVDMFHQAQVIAGFGGSGMFNTMFAPRATVLVISGDSYRANNEYLIRAVLGGDIHYFWGDSLIKPPRGGWTWAAYQSNFTFHVARFESEIARITAAAEAAKS